MDFVFDGEGVYNSEIGEIRLEFIDDQCPSMYRGRYLDNNGKPAQLYFSISHGRALDSQNVPCGLKLYNRIGPLPKWETTPEYKALEAEKNAMKAENRRKKELKDLFNPINCLSILEINYDRTNL